MKIFPFRAIYPDLGLIASPDTFFSSVKYQFTKYRENGFYNQSSCSSLYIYEIDDEESKHLGLLACIDIRDYIQGNIKVHENTLAYKEKKYMDKLLRRESMIKPILLSHPRCGALQRKIAEYSAKHRPFLEVDLDNSMEHHRFWRVEDEETVMDICTLFDENIAQAYIADGHHRSAVSRKLYEMKVDKKGGLKFDKLFCAFFGFDQLRVGEFNRIISVLNEVTPAYIMARLSKVCDIEPLDEIQLPGKAHQLTMLVRNECYSLEWKKELLELYDDNLLLDPAIFNKHVCQDILGIENVKTDNRINFVEGSVEIGEVADMTDYSEDVTFFLYPITFDQFKYCSDRGIKLPPKSTYFEPRMINGIIVQTF